MDTGVANESFGQVVEVPLSGLRCWEANPKRISATRLQDLQRALEQDPGMLWARPLIALPDGTVICGNQRLRAGLALDWETIPVLFVDLDMERAKVWALRDNNIWGEWDEPLLAELLADLAEGGIELALTGFESGEIDRLLAGFGETGDPDALPELPAGPPDSKPGELYQLGQHRLFCGNCCDSDGLAELFGRARAEMLLTDPPYGVGYVGKTAAALTIRNDDASGLPALLGATFAAIDARLAESARLYVFAPAGPAGTEFRLAFREVGWAHHQTLVWVKDSIVLGHSDRHYQHEDVLYGWKSGPGRPGRGRHSGSRWYGGNNESTVLYANRPKRSTEHPTAKPVGLLESMVRSSSRHGELVFDPFAGSGSTLIACERLGRRARLVELDPRYCDVIRHRFEECHDGSR